MKTIAKICFCILLLSMAAKAEIEKTALPCDKGLCLYWWPKLPPLKGWHQDINQSYHYRINTLAPDGSSFTKAEAVIYAKASYKPQIPDTKTLEMFIADDRKEFVDSVPDITIKEVNELISGDGEKFRSFTFFPKEKGNWEQVAYGEEGEYYLAFTLSSHSKEAFDRTQSAYRDLIAHYKVKF
ncbi:MAG: hypothetical protein WCE53_11710 [Candidatus Acidiferrum sp.]